MISTLFFIKNLSNQITLATDIKKYKLHKLRGFYGFHSFPVVD